MRERCWVVAILLSYERWSSKFSIGTRKSVWYCVARVQDGSAKTTLYFHHLKKKKKKSQTFSPKAFHKPDLSQKSLHWESAGDAELNSVKALLFFSLVGYFVENAVVLGGLA